MTGIKKLSGAPYSSVLLQVSTPWVSLKIWYQNWLLVIEFSCVMVTAFWKMTSWCSLIGSHRTWWHSYSRCWEPQIICCGVCLYTYLKQYVTTYTKAKGKAGSIQACYRPWGFQEV
jgi:hypothetical protein